MCRTLHVAHPDHLNDLLTPRQLVEWWVAYQTEPWGENRADYRDMANLMMSVGHADVKCTWPYLDTPLSVEEMKREMVEIESKANGNSSQNTDPA